MRKIANTILCYGIAMILLLFGMNFDEAGALFHTRNVAVESSMPVVYTTGAILSEAETVSAQIVGTKSESPVQQIVNQFSFGKKDTRNIVCILLADILLDNDSYSDKAITVMDSPDIHHRVVVLNYIHDLDGKKRV